jgi:hypothetical protein
MQTVGYDGIIAIRPVRCASRMSRTLEPTNTTDWCATSARCIPRSCQHGPRLRRRLDPRGRVHEVARDIP